MKFIFKLCLLGMFLFQVSNAGETGKLAGTIKDFKTKEPVIGVNILIVGTNIGASTDINGFYVINNISPGIYSLKISCIGYHSLEVKNVRIMADVTTEHNQLITESAIVISDAVVVLAQRPLVQKDRTSSQTIIEGETVSRELRLTSVSDILTLQAGVTKGSDGALHIRGGRTGGIVYQIDGMPVVNPFDRSYTGVLEVDRILEMQTHLGTFDAEYGNAADAVVSIVTRDGGEKYKVKMQYLSPRLNGSPYHEKDWNLNRYDITNLSESEKEKYKDAVRKLDGSSAYEFVSMLDNTYTKDYRILNVLGTFNGSISGPFPFIDKLRFFVTGRFRNEDSYLPSGYSMYRSSTIKLSYPISNSFTVRGAYDWSQTVSQSYDHQYKYWNWFDSGLDPLGRGGSYPIDKTYSNRQMIQLKNIISSSTFWDINLSRVHEYYINAVPNRLILFDGSTGNLITSNYLRRLYVGGVEGNFRYGDVRYFIQTRSEQYIIKGNYESQIDIHNQFRAGFEAKNHEIFRHRIGVPPIENLQWFTNKPFEGAAYIQDKLEYSFMILKAGLRLDYFDPQASEYPDLSDILDVVTNSTGSTDYIAKKKQSVKPKIQFSPRIGIAHPISDKTSIHFAYGHFFQVPTFYNLYRNDNLKDILVSDAMIGNPGLNPEKTVTYELGLQHQISMDWSINLTAYSKDITNLTSSFYYFVGRDYTVFTNTDFGRVQGIDVTLDKRMNNFFSGRLTYSLMYALGNQSDPLEGYNSYREENAHLRPNRNYFLDFDQRHKINLLLTSKFPNDFGPVLFGINPLELFSSTIIFNVGSGLPYTPTSRAAEESGIVPEPNSARRPWTMNLDLKVSKDINIGNYNLAVYLDIENLLDNLNVVSVWTRTGDAWDQGPTSVFPKDFQADPENMGPRRSIRLGIIIDF